MATRQINIIKSFINVTRFSFEEWHDFLTNLAIVISRKPTVFETYTSSSHYEEDEYGNFYDIKAYMNGGFVPGSTGMSVNFLTDKYHRFMTLFAANFIDVVDDITLIPEYQLQDQEQIKANLPKLLVGGYSQNEVPRALLSTPGNKISAIVEVSWTNVDTKKVRRINIPVTLEFMTTFITSDIPGRDQYVIDYPGSLLWLKSINCYTINNELNLSDCLLPDITMFNFLEMLFTKNKASDILRLFNSNATNVSITIYKFFDILKL